MIIIDEITAEHGGSEVVRMQAIDFAKLIRDRHDAIERAREHVRKAQYDADKMGRDLTAERDRHARAEADADKAINALRTALRALLEQADAPTIPGLEEAKEAARRTLDEHEEIPF